jgi:hypothetical protein
MPIPAVLSLPLLFAASMSLMDTSDGVLMSKAYNWAFLNPLRQGESTERPDAMLDPDAIAASYLHVLRQPRSAWTWEIELRPWTEKF